VSDDVEAFLALLRSSPKLRATVREVLAAEFPDEGRPHRPVKPIPVYRGDIPSLDRIRPGFVADNERLGRITVVDDPSRGRR